jgi:dipeptidyl-peptidase-3
MKRDFNYIEEKFSDIQLLRYRVEAWDTLSLREKKFIYFLNEAGNYGRDILFDQNYKHNLLIRDVLEQIVFNYSGFRGLEQFENFLIYVKRVWFSNGIHHHYSSDKFVPKMSPVFFKILIANSEINYKNYKTYNFSSHEEFESFMIELVFNEKRDSKKVCLEEAKDLIKSSAVNFYEGLNQSEVEQYFDSKIDKSDKEPISYGLNSRLIKRDGEIIEEVYKVGGKYSPAIEKIVENLEKALQYAENKKQKEIIVKLIDFYRTGNLKKFDEFSIDWVKENDSFIDFINGFIEVYEDPLAYKATFESVVSFKDKGLTEKFDAICSNIDWFENNMPFSDEFKRDEINDVSYRVINIAGVAGDCYPTAPLGINLPNSDWIREKFGSKSVSLSNIEEAHEYFDKHSKVLSEFYTLEQQNLLKSASGFGSKLHTCLHEVIGHGSGKIKDGVASPKETLKNYASTLEEARADLVALYFMLDENLINIGVIDSFDVAYAEYQSYIVNGLMGQLKRIKLGNNIEESHMRNRQLIAQWVYEKGKLSKVIEKQIVDNKSYFVVNDYQKLRALFADLLKEVQRIKSEGDFEAGKNLVENYGVKVQYELHKEVIERYSKLDEAAYRGFINPDYKPIYNENEIVDIEISYKSSFQQQSLDYSKKYKILV